jgi:hypothetical protein
MKSKQRKQVKLSYFSVEPARAKPSRRSQLIFSTLILFGSVTLLALIGMRTFKVPMGQGFAYRYSDLAEMKVAMKIWPAIFTLLPIALSAYLIANPRRPWIGLSLGMFSMVLLSLWTALGIPQAVRQHCINLVSPSHEGAFVLEAHGIPSLPDYLRNFNTYIHRPVRAMGGTRVLANPPGMTILAVAERRAFPIRMSSPTWLERMLTDQQGIDEDEATLMFAHGLRFGMILLAMWALSAPLAYLLGREFMAPLGAALFALLVTFNPCTVHFSPGKDAAQLLTVNAMLLAWFAGVRRDRTWATAIGGAVLLVGAICGLIHFWIAIAALAASGWQAWSDGDLRRVLLKHVTSATLGFLLLAGLIYLISGWNCLSTLVATGRLYDKVKNTIGINETLWLFIGLPIFLLFVTPAFWASAVLMFRRGPRAVASRFRKSTPPDPRNRQATPNGARLLACVVISMALSYALGVSWELPRVWIAYLPLLFLAVMIDVPLFKYANRRALRPILTIAIVSVIFTVIHWTMLDVRESEYRSIITNRAWY